MNRQGLNKLVAPGGGSGVTDHGALTGLADDDHTQYLLAAGSRGLSANWDAGSYKITAQQLESDVVTGTAPLVVASTTKVTNLNADKLDDYEALALRAEVKAITVENPGAAEDLTMFFTDVAITVTQLNAVLANGSSTPSVTWTIRHASDRSAAGTEVVTGGTTTTSISTGSEVTSFDDATIPAGSWVWLETTAQSGTVPELHVSVRYTID